MINITIQEQINVLKHNREVEILTGSYKEAEIVAGIKSKIKGYESELEYHEKQRLVYRELLKDKEKATEEMHAKYMMCDELVEHYVVLVNNLSFDLIEAEEKYELAREIATLNADENYKASVEKIIGSIREESEIENQ